MTSQAWLDKCKTWRI